ncbi:Cro/CI family transcriptional regulator [Klebsiella variicola subsp. variicola]|uniref:Cro/CI family transcriptional regulator n=1 Tax=Klebsiella pneumoniae complex TaxID=3390273 RepID=UPI000C7A50D0|nr:Cro/CI family transcriptional regulator [Klebsiella variicola]EIY5121394.1 cell division protein [Klebsiella quasipneumoniae]HBX8397828.1 cell division protein [Klebsiella pneumoniae]HCI4589080.1 cell division protein [Klebsiella quasipneumoniae subsp. quasipneumoniae]HCI6064675.1 cell division protein [Klebsiella variicola subsp. variicola]EIY5465599.1 cell division protein [Klebsiella quasipneumoniae]
MTTDDVEKYFGNAEKVAEFFGITSEAVYQWRNRPGRLIPKGRAAEAAYRTDGKLVFSPELYKKSTCSISR